MAAVESLDFSSHEAIDPRIAEFVRRYRDNRLAFVREVREANPVEWQQDELQALDEGCTRISVRSGHGVGKTTWLAWVVIHHLLFRTPCKIACTAPSAPQLFDVLAAEIKKWFRQLPEFLQQPIEVSSDRLYWRNSPSNFCTFRTARVETPEALQGIHEGYVLLVVDEASGVHDAIFESGSGSMSTAGAITLLTSNPTRRSGFFFKTQTEWADEWRVRKVSCFDSLLVTPKYIEEQRKRYGVDSAIYAVRVLGEFPAAEEDTFIPYHVVESAINRDIQINEALPVYWGLDVARSEANDASALCKRRGDIVLEPVKTWRLSDTMELVAHVKHEYDMASTFDRPSQIFVDSIGFGGPVADRLRQLELPAVDVNVAELPSMDTNYHRLRDDLWGAVRAWFNTRKVSIPKDDDLVAELTTPLIDFNRTTQKIICESKRDMKKRGVDSPDRADALCLTFAYEGSIAAGQNLVFQVANINDNLEQKWMI